MKRRTRGEWEELIREQELSGLSQQQFCKERGVSQGTFQWRKKKHKRERSEEGAFIELPCADEQAMKSSICSATVELELPCGAVFRLSW